MGLPHWQTHTLLWRQWTEKRLDLANITRSQRTTRLCVIGGSTLREAGQSSYAHIPHCWPRIPRGSPARVMWTLVMCELM